MQRKNQSVVRKTLFGVSYGRVSTDSQFMHANGTRKEDASPEAQKIRCFDHVAYLSKSNSKGVCYEISEHISDEGYSGKDTHRPGFQRMWNLIASGKIHFVVATELSRLSRSVKDFLELVEHCGKYNVDVFVIGLRLDTTDAFGKFVLVMLVAMAQFEREITSQRVAENALARLITDGKINGTSEILGLIRDPNRKGHFLVDPEGVMMAEKVMKLFLQFSSKKKVLDAAKKMKLTGTRGRQLTLAAISSILENSKRRYRGIWPANEENKNIDPEILPELKRFKEVQLPHGPLIEIELLDKVVEKLKDTYDKKKRSGRDNHIYLLSNLLFFEDDTSFGGQPGKNREYRYYYNKKNKIRIRCDELDPIIIRRFKSYVKDHDLYQGLVQQAIRRRQTNLPKVDAQIQTLRKALADLDDGEAKLRGELFKPGQKGDGFMPWLEEQVSETKKQREQKLRDLDALERARKEVLEQAGLSDLDKLLKEFMDGFDDLTPVQQRNFVEKFIKKIVVKPGNKIDLHLYGESPLGAKRKKSTDSDLYGRGGGQSRNPL